MPARRVVAGRRAARPAFMAVTLGWLILLVGLLSVPGRVHAGQRDTQVSPMSLTAHRMTDSPPPPPSGGSPTPTPTPIIPLPIPTTPTVGATAVPSMTATSATSTATVAPTDTPVTSSDNGSIGPQPTKVVFTQPTVGAAGGGSGLEGFTPADLSSSGLFIFTTLGCVMGLFGLVAVLVTWTMLVSDGWGPVVKALLLGNRHGRRQFGGGGQVGRDDEQGVRRAPAPAARGRGGWR